MKESRNEKMSEYLINVDEKIIDRAYEIDDAEKLRQYVQKNSSKAKKPFYTGTIFRRVVAIAACLVLIVGAMLAIPALLEQDYYDPDDYNDHNHNSDVIPPWIQGDESYLTINSIAKLNYYAAIRMISKEPEATGYNINGVKTEASDYGFVFLSNGAGVDEPEKPPVPETTGPDGYQEPDVTPSNPTPPSYDEDIYYYSLDPNEPFYINKVSIFQIELTDETGFLASKLGLGVVDVVISEECIWGESLITFRNGDNFYSCLSDGWGYDRQSKEQYWHFTTHKYVEGFFIVKNFEQENYGFFIKMDMEGQVLEFNCSQTQNGGSHVDKNVKVISTTVISEEGRSFTVSELENYFNTGKLPAGTEDSTTTPKTEDPTTTQMSPIVLPSVPTADFYTNGRYTFELISDGSFTYYSWDGNSDELLKGYYSWGNDSIEFQFMHEHNVVETVSCALIGQNCFIYNGSEYAKEPYGGE